MVVMLMYHRWTVMVISPVLLIIMLRAVVLPVISRAVMSSMTSGQSVFFIVVALTIAVVPIDFVVYIVFVNPLLIAIAVAVFRHRSCCSQEGHRGQNEQYFH